MEAVIFILCYLFMLICWPIFVLLKIIDFIMKGIKRNGI